MIRAGSLLALAFALVAAVLIAPAHLIAATDLTGGPDLRAVPRPPAVDLDSKTSQATNPPRTQAGNPLWAVPLSSLTVTRERPLFSASRRPPPAPVAARPVVQAPAPPQPRPSGPQRPSLSLVGTVAGAEGIAIFIDQSNQSVVRLRTGEGHDGWVLRTVGPREVTLQNDRDTAILALPPLQAK
jgi:general secretion pathway protein N